MAKRPGRTKEETERLVNQTASKIVDAFREGVIPQKLAPVFLNRKDDVPCRGWSWRNQLLTAIEGHSDARTFKAWKGASRNVKKGQKAFYILEPVMVKRKDKTTGDDVFAFVGTRPSPRFGLDQTEGQPLPVDHEYENWLRNLPFMEVAKNWGLKVEGFNGGGGLLGGILGRYRRGESIALGVKNLSTWTHEMVHAADDRLGNLKERGQHWRSETVAELGGCILLTALGLEHDADKGGCWDYVQRYASKAGIDVVKACMDVLDRVGKAVSLILDEAEKLSADHSEKKAA